MNTNHMKWTTTPDKWYNDNANQQYAVCIIDHNARTIAFPTSSLLSALGADTTAQILLSHEEKWGVKKEGKEGERRGKSVLYPPATRERRQTHKFLIRNRYFSGTCQAEKVVACPNTKLHGFDGNEIFDGLGQVRWLNTNTRGESPDTMHLGW